MTQTAALLEMVKKFPVFDTIAFKNAKDRKYLNLVIHRLNNKSRIKKIEKNKYTISNDPFLVASRIIWPSYISCWSALSYHKLTEQVPQDICVVITFSKKRIKFCNTQIRFIKTKHFFGYQKVKYLEHEIFIANEEKAIIDTALLKQASFSEIAEILRNNIKEINFKRVITYLKQVNNKTLIKRIGYVLETLGRDPYSMLKQYIDSTYVVLDYSKPKNGLRNKKWRLIINA